MEGFDVAKFTSGTWVAFRPALDPLPASVHAGRKYCAVQVRLMSVEEYQDALYKRDVLGGVWGRGLFGPRALVPTRARPLTLTLIGSETSIL